MRPSLFLSTYSVEPTFRERKLKIRILLQWNTRENYYPESVWSDSIWNARVGSYHVYVGCTTCDWLGGGWSPERGYRFKSEFEGEEYILEIFPRISNKRRYILSNSSWGEHEGLQLAADSDAGVVWESLPNGQPDSQLQIVVWIKETILSAGL